MDDDFDDDDDDGDGNGVGVVGVGVGVGVEVVEVVVAKYCNVATGDLRRLRSGRSMFLMWVVVSLTSHLTSLSPQN